MMQRTKQIATKIVAHSRRSDSKRAGSIWILAMGVFLGVLLANMAQAGRGSSSCKGSDACVVVQQALDQSLAVLAQADLSAGERFRRVEAIVIEHFDLDTMSRLVLARSWQWLSVEERRDFRALFQQHLAHRYRRRVDRFSGNQIDVVGERMEAGGDITVRTMVASGEFYGTPIGFRMRSDGDRWRAIDAVIAGVSLISSYREQFASVLKEDSSKQFLELIRRRLAALETAEFGGDRR